MREDLFVQRSSGRWWVVGNRAIDLCSALFRRGRAIITMRDTDCDTHILSSNGLSSSDVLRTPPFVSPPKTDTPPAATARRSTANGQTTNGHDRDRASEAIDPDKLSMALRDFEEAGRQRERTPGGSPSRKRQRVYGDRLVKSPILKARQEASRVRNVSSMSRKNETRRRM